MNCRMATIAALVVLALALLLGVLRNDDVAPRGQFALRDGESPAGSPDEPSVATAARPAPAPEGARRSSDGGAPLDEAARELAIVALENGPPSLRLFRCAALARLLGERRTGADRARYEILVTDLDAAIAQIRDYPAAVVDESAGSGADPGMLPTPEAALQATRDEAARVGPRVDQWLDNSWARCDQEVQWLDQVRVLLPVPPA
jgi:hypothetical protein